MIDKLKPCPFCRGEATTYARKDKEAGQIFYGCMCKNTGCCMIPSLYMSKAQVIELWNRRAGEHE